MIADVSRLVQDFKAITAAAVPSQMDILESLKDVIDERINELKEEIATNGDSTEDSQESASQEEG